MQTARVGRIVRRHPNLVFHPAGLSDQEGTATLHVPVVEGSPRLGLASLGGFGDAATSAVSVPLTRLDDAVPEGERVSFVKCDVEGHERSVFRGGRRVLSQLPTLLVEIEQRHYPASESILDTFAELEEMGYAGWGIYPDGLRPLSEFDLERDQTRHVSGRLQESVPEGYVSDFAFLGAAKRPPPGLLSQR